MTKVTILGSGSWGTTLALIAVDNGHDVTLWVRDAAQADLISKDRENKKYLEGVSLPDGLNITASLPEAISGAEVIVNAVPVQATRAVMKEINGNSSASVIVNASKGIEMSTGKRVSQVVSEELGDVSVVALSGPNLAPELCRKLPAATVIAGNDDSALDVVKGVFHNSYFRLFVVKDIVGVEIAGAVKNIIAITTGVAAGLGMGDNLHSALVTLGLYEMAAYGAHCGGQKNTFFGIAGIGDLMATCTSSYSRNHRFGVELSKGKSADDIVSEIGMVVEGMATTKAVHEHAVASGLKLPLIAAAYAVLYEGKDLKEAISGLLELE